MSTSLKMLREQLSEAQTDNEWPVSVRALVKNLIMTIDRHRPLEPDGTHRIHTATCGCEDKWP